MRNWKPFVKYNDKFLDTISWFMKVGGISLFPFIILREKYRDGNKFEIKVGKKTINHETIHFQQALELGVIPFYVLYVLEWILKLPIYGSKSYYNISFEREAYDNDDDLMYLEIRRRYNWIKRILK
tara:strand:+ start:2750 stop:3127 length:378 start_codon:yes stop_codon:yes gene_type:complete